MLRDENGVMKVITDNGLVLLISSVEYRIPAFSVNRGFDEQWKGPGKDQGILQIQKDLVVEYMYTLYITYMYIYRYVVVRLFIDTKQIS